MKRSEKKKKRIAKLERLEEKWADCEKCSLHKNRTNIVFWRGHPLAKLFIVGEAPGRDEDKKGIPFIGVSGKLLNEIIDGLDIRPKRDVFIANTVGCFPPMIKGSRAPDPSCVFKCRPRLERMLDIVKPKAMLLLGMTAARSMVGATTMKGSVGKIWNVELWNESWVHTIITYHPSYLLRSGKNSELRDTMTKHIAKAWKIANAKKR
jgi:DNA polymerase